MNQKISKSLQVSIGRSQENFFLYLAKLANLIIFNSILEQIYIIQNGYSNVMTNYDARITPKLNLHVLLSECMNGGGRH